MNHLKNIYLLLIIGFATGCTVPAEESPEDMVFFNGGTVMIGAENAMPNEAPVFKAEVKPFYIDKSPVTVAEFRQFVQETGYITEAEKFGNSAVFFPGSGRWKLIEGAHWVMPFGKDGPEAIDDHPVTQVSWNDAKAYAEWKNRRLPTEIEWEFAAKGGEDTKNIFSWGNELKENGVYKANVWQGKFPIRNLKEDGFMYTSPVGAFGKTKTGLTDMGGNVWEWTSSTYKLYEGNPKSFQVNPRQKVIRGGSFLCEKDVCYGYRVSARQFNSMESATFHMGFRTAKDAGIEE